MPPNELRFAMSATSISCQQSGYIGACFSNNRSTVCVYICLKGIENRAFGRSKEGKREWWGLEVCHIAPCNSGLLKCWADTACSAQHGFRSPRATGIPKELTHCFFSPSTVFFSFPLFRSHSLFCSCQGNSSRCLEGTSCNVFQYMSSS